MIQKHAEIGGRGIHEATDDALDGCQFKEGGGGCGGAGVHHTVGDLRGHGSRLVELLFGKETGRKLWVGNIRVESRHLFACGHWARGPRIRVTCRRPLYEFAQHIHAGFVVQVVAVPDLAY